ncbi:retrovirus-related Pol polyprotein from transposon 297 [Trichonephila clavipes]|nr:retrovirus-related Pol polyprotein from transposon 297 [Trichonephila clavipes]
MRWNGTHEKKLSLSKEGREHCFFSQRGKLIYGHLAGRRLPDNERPHYKILQIMEVNGGDKGINVVGQINNISCHMVVDPGANVSIIRKDWLKTQKIALSERRNPFPCKQEVVLAENGKFRFNLSYYDDTDFLKAGLLIASVVVDLSNSVIPARIANISDKTGLRGNSSVCSCHLCRPEVQCPRPFFRGSSEGFTTKYGLRRETMMCCRRVDYREFQSLFSRTSDKFERTRLPQHRIDTGEHPPLKQHPRRLPFAKKEEVLKLIKGS